jgi:hypothetical protein
LELVVRIAAIRRAARADPVAEGDAKKGLAEQDRVEP